MRRDVDSLAPSDVLFVVEQLRRDVPGGIGTYVRGVLSGLLRLDAARRPSIELFASKVAGADPLAALGFPLATSRLPARLVTRMWDRGYGAAPKSQVLHAPSFSFPPNSDAPIVMTVHDLAFLESPDSYPERGRRWHERALRSAIERVGTFIVPATEVATALESAGAAHANVHVIEEGADHLPEPDVAAASQLRSDLGVDSRYLLAVGTLEPRKNLARLFEAYALARSRQRDLPSLVVVGPQGWGSALDSVPDGVVLAGMVPDATLAGLYAGAHLCCYVPLLEGFGLPVVEAMSQGTPVLSSPVPAAGGATLLVDPFDVESIAEGLERAISDDPLRKELIAAGEQRVSGLTWQRAAASHVAVWHSAYDRSRP